MGAGFVTATAQLRDLVRDLAFRLPEGDPVTSRLELILMELVHELSRMDERLERIAAELLSDLKPKEGQHDVDGHTGSDRVLGQAWAPEVAGNDARR